MEIVQSAMTEMTEAMRSLTGTESPQDRAQRQAELLKAGYERAVSHIREISDLIQKSSTEALDLLNRRFAEAMEEVKQLAAKK
jgi:phasin family protein